MQSSIFQYHILTFVYFNLVEIFFLLSRLPAKVKRIFVCSYYCDANYRSQSINVYVYLLYAYLSLSQNHSTFEFLHIYAWAHIHARMQTNVEWYFVCSLCLCLCLSAWCCYIRASPLCMYARLSVHKHCIHSTLFGQKRYKTQRK